MPNIATVLKDEISRIARKEIRAETAVVKKASAQYRKDIAELKRQVSNMQGRVSAKGLASQRKRLGLSASDYGKLIGVTGHTIYSWEKGSTRPRKTQLPVLASIRQMGKKEAQARLEQLSKGSQKKP
jgi:DNA-binding transcriptional regulator YiaG